MKNQPISRPSSSTTLRNDSQLQPQHAATEPLLTSKALAKPHSSGGTIPNTPGAEEVELEDVEMDDAKPSTERGLNSQPNGKFESPKNHHLCEER